jgi:hypothetical protein
MKIAEAMCKEENCSLAELLEKYKIRKGKISNYEIEQTTSEPFLAYRREMEHRKEERERPCVAQGESREGRRIQA